MFFFLNFIEIPEAPINVTAVRDGAREATVRWTVPSSMDTRDLIGYIVEARESPDIASAPPNRWTRIGPSTVRDDTKLRLTDINPSTDIQFHVIARNSSGMSEPSEPTVWLKKPEPEGKFTSSF